jgi:tRNA(Ile)-lysidine synthase
VSRREIDGYIAAHRLKVREDATNADPKHTRNRLRHEIIPALEKAFGRGIKPSILRAAEILAAENEWIAGMLDEPGEELSLPVLRAMPEALQRRTIHAWLKKRKVADCGFSEVEAVRSLLPEGAARSKINLPGGLHARRRAKKLFVE